MNSFYLRLAAIAALWLGAAPAVFAQLPAFPGAEGFGKYATGARGGTVYHVTTTNDSGPGSFRDAVSVSGRTIVFDIGGIIDYKTPRYAPKANIYIAGQTAPGDGVTLYGNGLSFSGSHNNIVRFLRVREGINGDSGTDCIGIANGHDMIFDHMSVSWGRDETFSVNASGAATNITIQSTIIAQGLQTHSAGGLIQTDGGVSILRCLYIDNDTRNPKVKFKNEFVNNVIANWETIGYNMGGDSAGDSYANCVGNYLIKGPNSSSSAFGGGNANFHIYATNNWLDANRDGILNGTEMAASAYAGPPDLQASPFAYPITNAMPPLTALKFAISDVGTSLRRDVVDQRLMFELQSGGLVGQTISSEYATPMNGPGIIKNGPTPVDTDQDGMPDYWENGTGSNPSVANNNDPSPSGSGYTRLEDYLNWLCEPHGLTSNNAPCEVELRQFTRGFTNYSPVFTLANATNGTVSLVAGGTRARFTPTAGYTGPAGFTFTVTDSDGSTVTRQYNLFVTPVVTNTTFTWRGDALTNKWNVGGDLNWFDNYSLVFPFHNGDTVLFDDTGFNTPTILVTDPLLPASVTVNAAQNYTVVDGGGSLGGSMPLLKAGTGIFRLNNLNTYSGNTTVSNGTLLVNGKLVSSLVSVLNGGSAGGSGSLGNGLTAASGGSVIAGDGIGATGTLTITNALTENGGVINRFDLTDDPTGLVKTNDQIRVVGDLNLAGVNTIQVSLPNGPLANGNYTLFTYSGTFNGSLANLTVVGANGVLTNPPGQIVLHVDNTRAPASLVWAGGFGGNTWDVGTNGNWLNGALLDFFYFGDTVRFDDTGAANPAVNLTGTLTPAALTVDATNSYTFSGTGKISGTGVFTKTNSGTLTITTTNDFTGRVIVGGGVLAVSRLANSSLPSGLGASSSDPTNLVFYGGTLRYTGSSLAMDRSATLNSNATLEVVSGTLTNNGNWTGSGALIKAGAGTLNLPTNNTFSGGLIISNGTVLLSTTTARDSGLGTGTCTLAGGTLQCYGYGGSSTPDYGTFNRPIFVAPGTTNGLLTAPRCTMASTLTGSGTLNLTVDYVRDVLSGNWSAFSGVINVTGRIAASEFRVANTTGYGNATVNITDNVIITRNGSPAGTVYFGALGGTSGSQVGPGNSTSSGATYSIGGNNADATFAGTLKSDGTNPFIKTGTGRWTLTGANTWNGGLTVNGGLVLANNASGSATGTGTVVVNTNGALGGTGSMSGAVTINGGGAIAPGSNGVGTVTMTGGLTLNSGAILNLEIGSTNDKVAVTGQLTLNGIINVTNLAGFGAGTYPIITYSGALSGALPTIGSKPSGYSVTVSTNTANQVRLIVAVQPPPAITGSALAGTDLVISGTGPTNGIYYILTATNAALPVASWTRVATNTFNANGTFNATNAVAPGDGQRFFRVLVP